MNRIMLITASNPADPYNGCSIHLGPLALDAWLTRHGYEVFIVADLTLLEKIQPHVVGISSVTENYGRALAMAREIRERHRCVIVVGGVHITSCPESLDPVFDAAVLGEGEETLLQFLRTFPRFEETEGLAFWKEGRLVVNSRRKSTSALDDLPHGNRKKWARTLGLPIVMTSRGCPYACSFCSSPLMWGGWRTFSPAYVLEEIKELVGHFGAQYIRFFDDILTFDRKRLALLVEMIRAEGLHRQVVFSCFSRIDHLDRETFRLLRQGNILFVAFGLESASTKVLETLKDRPPSPVHVQQILDLGNEEGIHMGCSVIIGAPQETEEDLLATYAFLSRNKDKLCEVEINPIVPHPGTPVWEYAKSRGLVGNAMDWGLLKDYSFIPLFNPKRYVYLNENIPYDKFVSYVKGFTGLYRSMAKMDLIEKYFGSMDCTARLNPPALQESQAVSFSTGGPEGQSGPLSHHS